MDDITGSKLVDVTGMLEGTLENVNMLTPNAAQNSGLKLDGVDQAVNFGNLKYRCLGK